MLRVKSLKFDWLRVRNEFSCMNKNKKHKQTLENVRYGLEIIFSIKNTAQRRKWITSEFKDSRNWSTAFTLNWYVTFYMCLHAVEKSVLYSSIFGNSRNNVTFLTGKTSTWNLDKPGSFKRLLEVSKPTKFVITTIKTLCHPSQPKDFLPPRFLVVTWPAATKSLSSNAQARQRRESLGRRLLSLLST